MFVTKVLSAVLLGLAIGFTSAFTVNLPNSIEDYEKESISSEGFTEEELSDMSYVDNKIRDLIDSDEYKSMSLTERKDAAEKMLTELKNDKKIKNLNYFESNYQFSFMYSNGVLGGVTIKDFDSMMN